MFSDSRVLDIAAGLRHSMAVTGVDNDAFYITTVENFIQHVCWTLCWTSRTLTNPQMAGRLATYFFVLQRMAASTVGVMGRRDNWDMEDVN